MRCSEKKKKKMLDDTQREVGTLYMKNEGKEKNRAKIR